MVSEVFCFVWIIYLLRIGMEGFLQGFIRVVHENI